MATSSTSCTTRTENSGVRPTCDCGRSTDLVVGCLLGQVESASNPSVTNDNRGLHSPLVGAWWVTTKIGTSIGCPSYHPFAMSKVRRPLTMAIGLLFGLGLDTAAEIGVLVLVGASPPACPGMRCSSCRCCSSPGWIRIGFDAVPNPQGRCRRTPQCEQGVAGGTG